MGDFPISEQRWLARQLVLIGSVLATAILVLRFFVHDHAPPETLVGWNGLICVAPMVIGQIVYWALLRPARR